MLSYLRFSIILSLLVCLVAPAAFGQTSPSSGGSGVFKNLVWSEEFNYNGLPNPEKWEFEKGYLRNKELQYYTGARRENAMVAGGYLTITARNDSFTDGHKGYPITSASISTNGKVHWTYGRIEVRAKIPASLGTWPAIWTLGTETNTVGWPAAGEIDILEHVGFMPDTVHFNVHTAKYNHINKTNKGVQVRYVAPYKDFHVYAIEWFKDHIDWYMDTTKVFTYKNEGEGDASWPFDKPQYLILNLAFGGAWGGARGVNVKSLPQKFLIDYVRVFQ